MKEPELQQRMTLRFIGGAMAGNCHAETPQRW
jgi:hypothetical protein